MWIIQSYKGFAIRCISLQHIISFTFTGWDINSGIQQYKEGYKTSLLHIKFNCFPSLSFRLFFLLPLFPTRPHCGRDVVETVLCNLRVGPRTSPSRESRYTRTNNCTHWTERSKFPNRETIFPSYLKKAMMNQIYQHMLFDNLIHQ